MKRYVYQVQQHQAIGAVYFSSWIKAFKYCNDAGLLYRSYEDNYITQMTNDKKTIYMEIKKENVR